MDAKMQMTISALGLEPPKASLLRRFRDELEPLGTLLGLRGVGSAPLARPAHPRQIVEDADVEDVEDVEDAEDVEYGEDVEDIEVGEDQEASTPPSTDFSEGRMQGEQGEEGEEGDDHPWAALSTDQLRAVSLPLSHLVLMR